MKMILISPEVLTKLDLKHQVSRREVEQCFENLCGTFLEDAREDHKTDPATLWFIAPTNEDRLLKVVFIYIDGNHHIRTAFPPDQTEIDLYESAGK